MHSDPQDVPSCTKNESGRPDGASSTPIDAQTSGTLPPADDGLISRTIAIWQPRAERTLSETDAREIVSNVARLFVLLDEWDTATGDADHRTEEGR